MIGNNWYSYLCLYLWFHYCYQS